MSQIIFLKFFLQVCRFWNLIVDIDLGVGWVHGRAELEGQLTLVRCGDTWWKNISSKQNLANKYFQLIFS